MNVAEKKNLDSTRIAGVQDPKHTHISITLLQSVLKELAQQAMDYVRRLFETVNDSFSLPVFSTNSSHPREMYMKRRFRVS